MISDPWYSMAVLIARVLLAGPYLLSGVEKARNFSRALDEFAEARIPFLRFTTTATITLHLVGSVCLIAGWLVAPVAIVLAVFTLVATLRVHDFWNMEGTERLLRTRVAFANYGLVGGLLLLAAVGSGSWVLF